VTEPALCPSKARAPFGGHLKKKEFEGIWGFEDHDQTNFIVKKRSSDSI